MRRGQLAQLLEPEPQRVREQGRAGLARAGRRVLVLGPVLVLALGLASWSALAPALAVEALGHRIRCPALLPRLAR